MLFRVQHTRPNECVGQCVSQLERRSFKVNSFKPPFAFIETECSIFRCHQFVGVQLWHQPFIVRNAFQANLIPNYILNTQWKFFLKLITILQLCQVGQRNYFLGLIGWFVAQKYFYRSAFEIHYCWQNFLNTLFTFRWIVELKCWYVKTVKWIITNKILNWTILRLF